MQEPPAVAAELTHAVETLGLKGVAAPHLAAGRELSDPPTNPSGAAPKSSAPSSCSTPTATPQGERLERFYFSNVIGNPLDTTVAVHYLIFDGVLARHPGLKIIAVHGGGYLGAYSGRIDHAWGARPDCRGDLKEPPGTYLRRMYVDTIVFTPHQLSALIAVFGPDHVLLGTDYPFDMGEYDPVGHVLETPGLDARKPRPRSSAATPPGFSDWRKCGGSAPPGPIGGAPTRIARMGAPASGWLPGPRRSAPRQQPRWGLRPQTPIPLDQNARFPARGIGT